MRVFYFNAQRRRYEENIFRNFRIVVIGSNFARKQLDESRIQRLPIAQKINDFLRFRDRGLMFLSEFSQSSLHTRDDTNLLPTT